MTPQYFESLQNWIKENFLKIEFKAENILNVVGFEGDFLLIEPKEEATLDEDCCLVLYEEEVELIEQEKVKYLLFEFGQRWYYTKPIIFKNKFNQIGYEAHFNDFKYIGDNDCELDNLITFVHLGIHDEYELMNGSQMSKDWAKKSVFLKHKAAGLADRNTLGGTLAFQTEFKKLGVKPILGMTASVADNYDQSKNIQSTNDLKLYVVNEVGWQNLFKINKAINVDFNKFIPEEVLLKYGQGLIAIFPQNSVLSDLNSLKVIRNVINKYEAVFDDLYYQIDSVEYDGDATDLRYLNQIKFYLDNFKDLVKPILINDSYYIDQEMYRLKEYLNKIGSVAYPYSEDQYFKTLDQAHQQLSPLFEDNDKWLLLLIEMCNNTVELANQCEFEIKTGESKLPKYEFAPKGMTNEEYYFQLIEEGIEKKLAGKDIDMDLYLKRIETECEVIIPAGFVDYFLILIDIVRWCRENNIEVGSGRGSVAGSAISWLTDLTKVDPIKNDLLFERFLNPTRVLPEVFYDLTLENGNKLRFKEGQKVKLINGIEKLAEELTEEDDILI